MSSITRALTGENLTFDLDEQIAELRRDERYVRSGRVGRTLVKAGPLRLTLTLIAEGVEVGNPSRRLAHDPPGAPGAPPLPCTSRGVRDRPGGRPLLRTGPRPGHPSPRGHGAPVDHHGRPAGGWVISLLTPLKATRAFQPNPGYRINPEDAWNANTRVYGPSACCLAHPRRILRLCLIRYPA